MKITPREYRDNKFQSAAQVEAYKQAQAMKSDYEKMARDMVSLDNQPGLDHNSQQGVVVLSEAVVRARGSYTVSERLHDSVGQIQAKASGQVSFGDDGKAEYELRGNEHQMSARYLDDGSLVLTKSGYRNHTRQAAYFFSDGTIDFSDCRD